MHLLFLSFCIFIFCTQNTAELDKYLIDEIAFGEITASDNIIRINSKYIGLDIKNTCDEISVELIGLSNISYADIKEYDLDRLFLILDSEIIFSDKILIRKLKLKKFYGKMKTEKNAQELLEANKSIIIRFTKNVYLFIEYKYEEGKFHIILYSFFES